MEKFNQDLSKLVTRQCIISLCQPFQVFSNFRIGGIILRVTTTISRNTKRIEQLLESNFTRQTLRGSRILENYLLA